MPQWTATWQLGEPIRAEPFSREHLEEHAKKLAAVYGGQLRAVAPNDHACWFRFLDNSTALQTACAAFAQAARKGEPITVSDEWLLDNYYIIEEQLRDIRDHIPKGFYRELPKLGGGPLAGYPQVYAIALELIAHTDSSLDEQTLIDYVRAYQSASPLTSGELWAIPAMLRLVLVENLRSMADQELHVRQVRREADTWLASFTEQMTQRKLAPDHRHQYPDTSEFLNQLKPQITRPAFLIRVAARIREHGEEQTRWLEGLERWLDEHGKSLDSIVQQEHCRLAANQVSIGNCVTSMRLIAALDWHAFFERTSPVEEQLRRDPSQVYPQMDFATRDRYRHAVEKLGRGCRFNEKDVAAAAVELAAGELAAGTLDEDPRRRHVGYWLVGPGKKKLAKKVQYRPTLLTRLAQGLESAGPALYFGSVALLTIAGVALLMWYAHRFAPGHTWLVVLAGLISAMPVSEAAIALVNFIVTALARPEILPKLEFKTSLPADCQTMVVIPTLLGTEDGVAHLLERLEVHYLANPEPGMYFALLTDFTDAAQEQMPTDERLLEQVLSGVRRLNDRYPISHDGPYPSQAAADRFFLFHRKRLWNEQEQKWMGWERKRGKLEEFNRLLRGAQNTTYETCEGRLHTPGIIRYVITLDTDTQLPPNAARKMVGALAHPLNRPRFDPKARRVVEGYGILQPRASVSLPKGGKSWFSHFSIGHVGIDPYTTAVSDVYQDVFSEGSFVGKGIYDVDAFAQSTDHAFPENQILSHDLIEGCHVRVGLISDIEVFDDFPSRYHAFAKRQHRWVRGDWQIAPWVFGGIKSKEAPDRPNPITFLSRWKIADNLRRSLMAAATLALLVAGWTILPGNPLLWTLVALAVLTFPVFAQLSVVLRTVLQSDRQETWRRALSDVRFPLVQVGLNITFLAFQAALMIDAICRSLYRMLFSHRHMLEWETASSAERRMTLSMGSFLSMMWPSIVIALIVFPFVPERSMLAAVPFLLLWIGAPWVAYAISRPIPSTDRPLTDADRMELRRIARRTWAYFENFISAEDHWLPPDNFQEYPIPGALLEPGMTPGIAHRTSPTNEGLFLVSALAAHDFGYLGTHEMVAVMEKNLDNWEKLETFRGHFLNWYDTHKATSLSPRYVSTVDSGNLAASFLTVREGLIELQHASLGSQRLRNGLLDTALLVHESMEHIHPPGLRFVNPALERLQRNVKACVDSLQSDPRSVAGWRKLLKELSDVVASLPADVQEFYQAIKPPTQELPFAVERLQAHLRSVWQDLESLVPEVVVELPGEAPRMGTAFALQAARLGDEPDLGDSAPGIATLEPTALPEVRAHEAVHTTGRPHTHRFGKASDPSAAVHAPQMLDDVPWREGPGGAQLIERITRLAERLQRLTDEMDFSLLYDPRRRLFAIGYNLENERLDNSHYDLLASEARLASFIAIGKGDVDAAHWFRLGRSMTQVGTHNVLLSWSGTMFEYLMPLLFQRPYADTLLDESCRGAVERQIEYGKANGVPWGISESAFSTLSISQDYHYQAFGVPGLGLKRGLGQDLVIAPYATGLAVLVDPHAALANFQALAKEGAMGAWGYYEALDYTRNRVPAGRKLVPVRCFMSHHQGMLFTAISNCLFHGGMQRRFSNLALFRATELLLQERPPIAPRLTQQSTETDGGSVPLVRDVARPLSRRLTTALSPAPRTHILSNGRYRVMVTNAGTGYSNHEDLQITRWRSDSTLDPWGQFILLSDLRDGTCWSATAQPLGLEPDLYEVIYSVDKAEFHRRDGDLETRLEVVVSPEHDVEVRQLTLINHGTTSRRIEVTSFSELALAQASADAAHPAFQKLFVQTEAVTEHHALLAFRRPRSPDQHSPWGMHVLAVEGALLEPVGYETDRARFLGRGRTIHGPAALDRGARLSGATGPVLDPIFSLRAAVEVAPGQTRRVAFTTGVAASRDAALALTDQYREPRTVQRVFELAWAHTQVDLRHQQLSPSDVHLYQRLAAGVLYLDPRRRARPEILALNSRGQSTLWRYGISGDIPMVVVRVSESDHVALFREVLRAHEYWRSRGLKADLVALNEHAASYLDALQEQLASLVRSSGSANMLDRSGGVFLLRGAHMAEEDRALVLTAAHIVLEGNKGALAQQIEPPQPIADLPAPLTTRELAHQPSSQGSGASLELNKNLEWDNGIGGFDRSTNEYVVRLHGGRTTEAPWINVLSNPQFGCLVSESNLGYTWSENSRENKLTPWSNDPVSDPAGETLYLRDEVTGEVWSPTPAPRRDRADYVTRHGAGYSRFLHESHGLTHECLVSIAPEDPVKFVQLTLRNDSGRDRELSATFCAEWVLGVSREDTSRFVTTLWDEESGALMARNPAHPEFGQRAAFLTVATGPGARGISYTGDRQEFFGRLGRRAHPAALDRTELSKRAGAGVDPCGAMQTKIHVAAGEQCVVTFVLGQAASLAEARIIARRYRDQAVVRDAIARTRSDWDTLLSAIEVETPHRAFDVLVNRWLLYQVLSCRMWGRSGFYQSGGAYGFRDQLQDSMAMVYSRPELARAQLLRHAARQFEQGDVQHWWHPPVGRGVRTRFSDDLLWLPYAMLHYLETTGDQSVLDERIPFLHSAVLGLEEEERYEAPAESIDIDTLFGHCLRAVDHSLRMGPHGLPLMGTGDWNDGYSRVGVLGQGETVWGGWFLLTLLDRMAVLCEKRGDSGRASHYRGHATALRGNMEAHGWDGAWYRRAFFDDGSPMGSSDSQECKIDSLPQSWAVFAGQDSQRIQQAMQSACEKLVRPADKLVLLFSPPFDKSSQDPGYVKGYLPGVRENGGQYTHAATWMVRALAELGQGTHAMDLFDMLNPLLLSNDVESAKKYKVEPYVVAADVYSMPPHVGRGGWTWYTGSAAWMYRVAIESLLGLKLEGNKLRMAPSIPGGWAGFKLTYRLGETCYEIHVENPDHVQTGVGEVICDGQVMADHWVPITRDGRKHEVRVRMGKPS